MPRLADLVWHQDDNVNTEINTKSFIAPKSIHLLDPLSNYVSAFLGPRRTSVLLAWPQEAYGHEVTNFHSRYSYFMLRARSN